MPKKKTQSPLQTNLFKDNPADAQERVEHAAEKKASIETASTLPQEPELSEEAPEALPQRTVSEDLLEEFISEFGYSPEAEKHEETVVPLQQPVSLRNNLMVSAEQAAERARNASLKNLAQWSAVNVEEYESALRELTECYMMLSVEAHEELEDLRLACKKEIIALWKKINVLCDRLDVTQGRPEKLLQEVSELGARHLRLFDQSEALSYALKQ